MHTARASLVFIALIVAGAMAHAGGHSHGGAGHAHEASDVSTPTHGTGRGDHSTDKDTAFTTMLTAATFSSFLQSNEMVALHVCWERGANCRAALPALELVAAALQTEYPSLKFARLCSDADRETALALEVVHTPTLLFYFEGEEVSRFWDVYGDDSLDYTFDKLLAFMRRNLSPPVTVLADEAARKAFAEASELAVIAYLSGDDDDGGALWRSIHHSHRASAAQSYAHVASLLRTEMRFGVVRRSAFADVAAIDAALAAAGVSAANISARTSEAVFYKNHHGHDHEPLAYANFESNSAGLRAFLEVNAHAPFGLVNASNYQHLAAMQLPIVSVFADLDDSVLIDALRGVMVPLARQYRGRLTFALFCHVTYSAHARALSLEPARVFPRLAIEDIRVHKNYALPRATKLTDRGKVADFLERFLSGGLSHSIRSAPAPEVTRAKVGTVVELVGSTFNAFIRDAVADVMLLIYAPWCGVCKNTMEPFGKVAAAFAAERRVVFAQIDMSRNDIDGYGGNRLIVGTPSLYLFPADSKVPRYLETEDPHVPSVVRDFAASNSTFGLRRRDFPLTDAERAEFRAEAAAEEAAAAAVSSREL